MIASTTSFALTGCGTFYERRVNRRFPPEGDELFVSGTPTRMFTWDPTTATKKRTTVIWVGGNPSFGSEAASFMRILASRGYTGVSYDRLGQGHTPRRRDDKAVQGDVNHLHALITSVGENAVLVGSSWGGALVLLFCATGFPVRGIVLLGAEITSDKTLQNGLMNLYEKPVIGPLFSEIAAFFAPCVARRNIRSALGVPRQDMGSELNNYVTKGSSRFACPKIIRDTAASERAMFLEMATFWDDAGCKEKLVRLPITAVYGDCDKIVAPQRHSQQLTRLLPHAAVIPIKGAGHQLHVTHADAVANAVIFTDAWANRNIDERPNPEDFELPAPLTKRADAGSRAKATDRITGVAGGPRETQRVASEVTENPIVKRQQERLRALEEKQQFK
jgi:pimeloyl-ACP methyl ester carboxylesterase